MTYPQQPYPPQQRSWFARHKILTGIGAVIAFLVVIGIAAGGGSNDAGSKKDNAASSAKEAPAKPADNEKPAEQPKKSAAEEFKAFVNKNGLPAEKAAVQHVTKVQGADEQNDILDSADIYTDYTGGMLGPHQKDGKLIASAFADWKNSKNGLVTVYDKDGEILSNGNF